MIQAVWPYWVIFERSMQQIFLQKYLKYFVTFCATLKNVNF